MNLDSNWVCPHMRYSINTRLCSREKDMGIEEKEASQFEDKRHTQRVMENEVRPSTAVHKA